MYAYGDEAPCYSSPRMLEEALGVDLRLSIFYTITNILEQQFFERVTFYC